MKFPDGYSKIFCVGLFLSSPSFGFADAFPPGVFKKDPYLQGTQFYFHKNPRLAFDCLVNTVELETTNSFCDELFSIENRLISNSHVLPEEVEQKQKFRKGFVDSYKHFIDEFEENPDHMRESIERFWQKIGYT